MIVGKAAKGELIIYMLTRTTEIRVNERRTQLTTSLLPSPVLCSRTLPCLATLTRCLRCSTADATATVFPSESFYSSALSFMVDVVALLSMIDHTILSSFLSSRVVIMPRQCTPSSSANWEWVFSLALNLCSKEDGRSNRATS